MVGIFYEISINRCIKMVIWIDEKWSISVPMYILFSVCYFDRNIAACVIDG